MNKRLEEIHNTSSWNSMYLNNTTVMDVITHKLGVKASDILDVETGNMAVRVALAETEVIEDTKKWLESQEIRLDVLEVRIKEECDLYAVARGEKVLRSEKIILVKNLPYGADQKELLELFSQYGQVEKLVMPESQ